MDILRYLPNLKELKVSGQSDSQVDDNKKCHINNFRANYQKVNTNPVNATTLVKEFLQQEQLQTLCLHKVLYKVDWDEELEHGFYANKRLYQFMPLSLHPCIAYYTTLN
jgi:hypothetical protein